MILLQLVLKLLQLAQVELHPVPLVEVVDVATVWEPPAPLAIAPEPEPRAAGVG